MKRFVIHIVIFTVVDFVEVLNTRNLLSLSVFFKSKDTIILARPNTILKQIFSTEHFELFREIARRYCSTLDLTPSMYFKSRNISKLTTASARLWI